MAAGLVPISWPWWGETNEQRWDSEFAKLNDIFTPDERAYELMQNNADLEWLCHE